MLLLSVHCNIKHVGDSGCLSVCHVVQVHAEGEAEHAAIGHSAVAGFVPADKTDILRRAMIDHDRDFALFYNCLADMLE